MRLEEASSRQRASGESFLLEGKGTLLTSQGAVSVQGSGEEEAFGCRSGALVGDQRAMAWVWRSTLRQPRAKDGMLCGCYLEILIISSLNLCSVREAWWANGAGARVWSTVLRPLPPSGELSACSSPLVTSVGGSPRPAASGHSRRDQSQWQREASPWRGSGHRHRKARGTPHSFWGARQHVSQSTGPCGLLPIPLQGQVPTPNLPLPVSSSDKGSSQFAQGRQVGHMGVKQGRPFPDLPVICSGFIFAVWPPWGD